MSTQDHVCCILFLEFVACTCQSYIKYIFYVLMITTLHLMQEKMIGMNTKYCSLSVPELKNLLFNIISCDRNVKGFHMEKQLYITW